MKPARSGPRSLHDDIGEIESQPAGRPQRDWPSRPGEFRPEPLTDSGRDTLASSGSCHRTKAAAFRWDLKLLPLTVDFFPTPVTCPVCSAGITPLHRYYKAVRPSPTHRYFRPRGITTCAFPLASSARFSSSVREPA